MRILVALLLSIALLSSAEAQTSTQPKPEKACGSGFTESFVPDGLLGCTFTSACKAHDTCYARCDFGGDRYGTPYCAKSEFSAERLTSKMKCDQVFYASIDKLNDGKLVCRSIGAIYTTAVVIAGQGPFNGIPPRPDVIEKLALSSATPEEASEKLRTFASLHQKGKIDFSTINLDDGALQTQLKSPLSFKFSKDGVLTVPKGASIEDIKKLRNLPR